MSRMGQKPLPSEKSSAIAIGQVGFGCVQLDALFGCGAMLLQKHATAMHSGALVTLDFAALCRP